MPTSCSKLPRLPLGLRITATALSLLLFLTSSPPLFAITMGQIKAVTGAGGQGSFSNLQNAGAASANLTAAMAEGNLKKTKEIIDAMNKFQAKAQTDSRKGIMPDGSTIPNGLKPGGLEVYNPSGTRKENNVPVTWDGVSSLASSSDNLKVTITQNKQNAFLYWNKFNVGPQTTVTFDQSAGGQNAGQWVAFNKVMSPSDPTHIFGNITAQGQVYILNQNGILFHNGSVVNTHAMVASTLPLNSVLAGDSLRGITGQGLQNNSGFQFLFSALPLKQSQNSFSDNFDPLSSQVQSDVLGGQSVIRVNAGSGYHPGDKVTGVDGIAAGSTVQSVNRDHDGYDEITLSQAVTKKVAAGSQISGAIAAANVGQVFVETGASLSAPVSSDNVGGRVMLVGSSVVNNGSISTPNGQTILAAGLQIGANGHASKADAPDPSLRGLDIYVGKVTDINFNNIDRNGATIGTVVNNGIINVPRGESAMAGKFLSIGGLNADGTAWVSGNPSNPEPFVSAAIDSITSVSLNGRVDLLAAYNSVPTKNAYCYDSTIPGGTTGIISLAPKSVIRILPDDSLNDKIIGSTLALPSIVSIIGNSVKLNDNSMILASGADVPSVQSGGASVYDMTQASRNQNGEVAPSVFSALSSGISITVGNFYHDPKETYSSLFLTPFGGSSSGDITIGKNVVISAAGSTGVKVDSSQNFLTVQLRGPELANSPLQQTSPVRGKNITVDIRDSGTFNGQNWIGTPLGNITGYVGLIQHTAQELTVSGGSISIKAGGSVTIDRDASFDVSGGWKYYSGGTFTTSILKTPDGRLVDISQATPDQIYSSLAPLAKTVVEYPYYSGGDGGSLTIQAPTMTMSKSTLVGVVVSGYRQLRLSQTKSNLPAPSSVDLEFKDGLADTTSLPGFVTDEGAGLSSAPTDIIIKADPTSKGYLLEQNGNLESPKIEGFGDITINNHDGSISIPVTTSLAVGPGELGKIDLKASAIDIQGEIVAGGGFISLQTYLYTFLQERKSQAGKSVVIRASIGAMKPGEMRTGEKALISSAGLVVNNNQLNELPVAITGGQISIGGYILDLGGKLDVSGGALANALNSTPIYGGAGKLSITSGNDITITTTHDGSLYLHAQLSGFAGPGVSSGSISLQAQAIQIGGDRTDPLVASLLDSTKYQNLVDTHKLLQLDDGFFNNNGFSTFSFKGLGMNVGSDPTTLPYTLGNDPAGFREFPAVIVSSGEILSPVIKNFILKDGVTPSYWTAPDFMRPCASLSLLSSGVAGIDAQISPFAIRGKVNLEEGASIRLDPQIKLSRALSSVPSVSTGSLKISGNVTEVDGEIIVPGGTISISGKSSHPDNWGLGIFPDQAFATMTLGSSARIEAIGALVSMSDPARLGRALGSVIPGGNVTFSGNLVLNQGALVDVSGAEGNIYVRGDSPIPNYKSVTDVVSDGGAIALSGSQFLRNGALLLGTGGGPTAAGGSLSVGVSDPFFAVDPAKVTPKQRLTAVGIDLGTSEGAFSNLTDDHGYFALDHALLGMDANGIENFLNSHPQWAEYLNDSIKNRPSLRKYFASHPDAARGFDTLNLEGNIRINGDLTLSLPAKISLGSGGVISEDGSQTREVVLSAPFVSIGTAVNGPYDTLFLPPELFGKGVDPTTGNKDTGIRVSANNIQVGNAIFNNVGKITLDASLPPAKGDVQTLPSGEIRGAGVLDVAGDLVLKGSVIYPVTACNLEFIASGKITVEKSSDNAPLPMSAGGSLSLYAREIEQGGRLSAPLGSITLGCDSTAFLDPYNSKSVPVASKVNLLDGSITSVSAYSPSGDISLLPYGIFLNGSDWIDPTGANLTTKGALPSKGINILSPSITTESRSVIDTRGGGDLFAYEWNSGLKGSIDPTAQAVGEWQALPYRVGDKVTYNGNIYSAILATTSKQPEPTKGIDWQLYWAKVPQTYAILPGYDSQLFPVNRFAQTSKVSINSSTAGDPGYSSTSLSIGDSITLSGGGGLPAGTYTLLPSRYALLDGAYLVTPLSQPLDGQPTFLSYPDGSSVHSGVRFNSLNPAVQPSPLNSLFLVNAPGKSMGNIAALGDYQLIKASQTLPSTSSSHPVVDAGSLLFEALQGSGSSGPVAMNLKGSVLADAASGGHGALINLVSTANFHIGGEAASGEISLDPTSLTSWNAGGLLIGGSITSTSSGIQITPTTSSITLDNGNNTLSAHDLILVSKDGIILNDASSLEAIDGEKSDNITVPGNGSLIRLSGDPSASVTRIGFDSRVSIDGLQVRGNVSFGAASVILDSSGAVTISDSSTLGKGNISIDAGKISLNFDASLDSDAATLNLSRTILTKLSGAASLSLTSYSTINIRNSGSDAYFGYNGVDAPTLGSLNLHAGELLGIGTGNVVIKTKNSISLDNNGGVTDLSTGLCYGPEGIISGKVLYLESPNLSIGSGGLAIGGFGEVEGSFSSGIIGSGAGSLIASGSLLLKSCSLVEEAAASTSITSLGDLNLSYLGDQVTLPSSPGLSAKLSLTGANVTLSTPVLLPSGQFSALATSGDLKISPSGSISSPMRIDVSGTIKNFSDTDRFTDAGSITLSSQHGKVLLDQDTSLSLGGYESGAISGGSAGSLTINAPYGAFQLNGAINAHALAGSPASFTGDFKSLSSSEFANLETKLFTAGYNKENGFIQSQSLRVRNNDVVIADAASGDAVRAWSFDLSADTGSITVNGKINASMVPELNPEGTIIYTGGSISLFAGKSLTLAPSGILDAHGTSFSNAGKGGSIDLEAGNNPSVAEIDPTPLLTAGRYTAGSVVDLTAGKIELYVGSDPSHQLTAGLGQASGTLHLRAPQTADAKDVQVNPIGTATIEGASAINVEGFFRQDANFDGTASIDGDPLPGHDLNLKDAALANADSFMSNYQAIANRIQGGYASILQINPGEQIENSKGSLLLSSDWDLSLSRYGPKAYVLDSTGNPTGQTIGLNAGYLTLKASGDITFDGALSDGFGDSVNPAANINRAYGKSAPALWLAPLLPLIADNLVVLLSQNSWSYKITAGADCTAASFSSVLGNGNVDIGIPAIKSNTSQDPDNSIPQNLISDSIIGFYQTIRTGTGDIAILAGGSIRYLNQFSTTYTAGSMVDPSIGKRFDIPNFRDSGDWEGNLGSLQIPDNSYAPNYSAGGGNILIKATVNIEHLQSDGNGGLAADSSRQLPIDWLSRNGYQDQSGNWGLLPNGGKASLTWWVNFANFYEGVATLGGGNLIMQAGGDISNVDASVATQARMTVKDKVLNPLLASKSSLVETGGGDLLIKAGGNLDAGVYYQERGNTEINVFGSIISNKTRNAKGLFQISQVHELGDDQNTELNDSSTWIPTSFVLGKGKMKVSSGSDALIGGVANAFLLAQGIQNALSTKTYFSTYDQSYLDLFGTKHLDASSFSASATTGDLVMRTMIYGKPNLSPLGDPGHPENSLFEGVGGYTTYQPWTRYSDVTTSSPDLMPATITLVALSKGISLQGNVTLAPSASGNLVMDAATSINGIYKGYGGGGFGEFSSTVNLSDASPSLVPSVMNPRAQASLSDTYNIVNLGDSRVLADINSAMLETGAYLGTTAPNLATKLLLHGAGITHAGDGTPLVMEALSGSLSGLTLYSSKSASISAGSDILDVGLFIQNTDTTSKTIISAGRDLLPGDASSGALHNSGDIQISGPGAMEVLAGRNIDLGRGSDNGDGTGVGITSIGNARNPALPFGGADISINAGYNSATQQGLTSLFSSAESMVISNWDVLRAKVLKSDQTVIDQWGNKNDPSKNLTDKSTYSYLVSKDLLWMILHVEDSLQQSSFDNSNKDAKDNLNTKLTKISPELWSLIASKKGQIQSILDSSTDPLSQLAQLQSVGYTKAQSQDLIKSKADNSLYQLTTDDILNAITPQDLTARLQNEVSGFWGKINSSSAFSQADKAAVSAQLFTNLLKKSGRDYTNPDSPEYKTYNLGGQAIAAVYGEAWYANAVKNLGNYGIASAIQTAINNIASKSKSSRSDTESSALDYLTTLNTSGLSSNDLFSKVLLDSEKVSFVSKDARKISEGAQNAMGILFGNFTQSGSVLAHERDIRTKNGGSITITAPGGSITLANTAVLAKLSPPGIVTEHGGGIDIFTSGNVSLGIGRIFTLRGGGIMIWSDKGDVAAGSSAKTVASAPPTRVLLDPQSGDVLTDLAGLSTGGGIGVLATVKNAPLGDVDLIAVTGFIDAGDAGIRASAKLNIATTNLRNGDNLAAASISGSSSSSASAPAAAPPAAAPPAAASAAAAANNSAAETASKNNSPSQGDDSPSIYSIDILGYGGGDEEEKKAADATVAPVQASL